MRIDNLPSFFDYKDSMQILFDTFKIKTILEFGLGWGTTFLLQNGRKVRSVELQVHPEYEGWFEFIQSLLKQNPNWSGEMYPSTDEYLGQMRWAVLKELEKKYDFIFVDPGTENRPLIVQDCIDSGMRIIAAHDTNLFYKNCPWTKANVDQKYLTIKIENTQGTTYFFREIKDYNKFKGALDA